MVKMEGNCGMGACPRCWGGMLIVLGLLILANVYYLAWDWAVFIAAILILKGIIKLVMPYCSHSK